MADFIRDNNNKDGIDRRGFLQCPVGEVVFTDAGCANSHRAAHIYVCSPEAVLNQMPVRIHRLSSTTSTIRKKP